MPVIDGVLKFVPELGVVASDAGTPGAAESSTNARLVVEHALVLPAESVARAQNVVVVLSV